MTPSQLLSEGVELMLYGMGSVFVFLTLLILSIHLMARLLGRIAPPAAAAAVTPATPAVQAQGPEPDVLAAIQAAISQHRARRD
ncbi:MULTISPECIES: OadG family protein [Pseudomonas]|uniref:OadG family protein n=1 Tax=Pseudomonas TaxID=286 RepID=UPI0008E8D221|nr:MULTISPECIES: OadG family transporter subunit [Pseudomonas]MAB97491.1 oxaloacetate decarboxylase [Pseudomonadaceae bacterium]NRH29048.1 oxaloacetate decarboxylase [Pseudomonas sp. MS19]SFT47333.1 oxaloacetate decarboxylase, gamma subunit [Pseudomonas marincola]